MKHKKLVTTFIVSFLIFLLSIYFYKAFSFASGKKLNYAEVKNLNSVTLFHLKENCGDIEMSRTEAREKIEALFDNPKYFLIEKSINNDFGRCYPLINLIIIKPELDIETFVITLTHELCHLYYNTADERYVSFMTFKILYESKDFNCIACKNGYLQICGYFSYNYDCGAEVQKYLETTL